MNNLAVTCHVVGGVGEKAARVYQKGTTNSAFVSTYAYSLLVQQKAGEALKIIEELPENPKGIPPQSPGLEDTIPLGLQVRERALEPITLR